MFDIYGMLTRFRKPRAFNVVMQVFRSGLVKRSTSDVGTGGGWLDSDEYSCDVNGTS